ncbi:MAG: IclR family transcriptional regulator [Gudongella sp.]|nr:IclR family transcriptional regulator [Gudongella sp.]
MIEVVQTVDRALNILELLSESNNGMGITEISDSVKLHKSTVHRLLGTLIYKGFVLQDMATNKYKISLKLYELGMRKIDKSQISNVSKSYTKALMEKLNEVVHLVIRDKNDIVYIDKVEANNTIRMASNIGKRSPLYCTAVGKVMLAFMPNEEVQKIWENTKIEKLTDKTIIDFNEFKRELIKIKSIGYAIDDEENEIGIRCIGAPVFNRNREIEGAISISGPSNRVLREDVEKYAKEVKKYAYLISKELGYRE